MWVNYQEHSAMNCANLCVFAGYNGSGKGGFIDNYLSTKNKNLLLGHLFLENFPDEFIEYAVKRMNIIFPYENHCSDDFKERLSCEWNELEQNVIKSMYSMYLSMKTKKVAYIVCPENGLHPVGQTEIGKIASEMAHLGGKIIIKTHSCHLMYGMRIFVKENKSKIGVCKIFWVKPPLDITEIDIDSDGCLSSYPDGLLDQFINNAFILF